MPRHGGVPVGWSSFENDELHVDFVRPPHWEDEVCLKRAKKELKKKRRGKQPNLKKKETGSVFD